MERVILLPLFFTTASAAVRVTVGANSALRASPLGLRALRDLGLVSQQLRELQELVQPAAEQGCKAPTQASEIASLRAVLDGGIVSLTGSLGELTASIEAASRSAPAPLPLATTSEAAAPASLKTLCEQASRLHRTVQKQREYILVLEEQEGGAAERTREVFDGLDTDGNGQLEWSEFEAGAAALLSPDALKDATYTQELKEAFERADAGNDASLSYEEFVTLMSSMRDDQLGPLRASFSEGLEQLLAVSLQMIALTLSSELSTGLGTLPPGRAQQLALYIDRWCDIEARAEVAFASAGAVPRVQRSSKVEEGFFGSSAEVCVPAECVLVPSSGEEVAAEAFVEMVDTGVVTPTASAATSPAAAEPSTAIVGAPPAADSSMRTADSSVRTGADSSVRTADSSVEAAILFESLLTESLLTEVGALAGELSLPNAASADSPVQRLGRSIRFAVSSLRQSLGFCARGIRILCRDLVEVALLLRTFTQGKPLKSADVQVVRRTLVDLMALVPYTIIMIFPLSPPGHVFAFSLMKKCFPAAIPSPFTAQRQDIYEIYTRIALEAQANAPPRDPIKQLIKLTFGQLPKLLQKPAKAAGQAAVPLKPPAGFAWSEGVNVAGVNGLPSSPASAASATASAAVAGVNAAGVNATAAAAARPDAPPQASVLVSRVAAAGTAVPRGLDRAKQPLGSALGKVRSWV
ncbi:hypothetical protein Ctob_003478, partial [Chrysochromulina tobinii]